MVSSIVPTESEKDVYDLQCLVIFIYKLSSKAKKADGSTCSLSLATTNVDLKNKS